jgi:hypothetical protein
MSVRETVADGVAEVLYPETYQYLSVIGQLELMWVMGRQQAGKTYS